MDKNSELNTQHNIIRYNFNIEFNIDFKFIAIIPAINLNFHSKEFEIEWLIFGLYIGNK